MFFTAYAHLNTGGVGFSVRYLLPGTVRVRLPERKAETLKNNCGITTKRELFRPLLHMGK